MNASANANANAKALARRRLALLLLPAILLWQTLGLLHGTWHHDGGAVAHTSSHAQMHEAADAATPQPQAAVDSLTRLFAHDPGSGDCRLLDQLSHADSLTPVVALCVPSLDANRVEPVRPDARVVRTSSPFQARGPPFSA